jgi:hypothetical protein
MVAAEERKMNERKKQAQQLQKMDQKHPVRDKAEAKKRKEAGDNDQKKDKSN